MSLFSIFFARRGEWYLAALSAFLAGLTRPIAVILILPLLWEYARQHGWLSRKWIRQLRLASAAKFALIASAVPLAVSAYALYLWYQFDNPFIFLQVQSVWQHQFVPLWEIPGLAVHAIFKEPAWSFTQTRVLVDVLPMVAFAALAFVGARRLPLSLTFFMVGVVLVSVASPLVTYFDPFASVGRYLIAAFPAYLLIGRWTMRSPWLHMLVMSSGFMLQALFAGFFLMGGWMVLRCEEPQPWGASGIKDTLS